MRSLLSLALFAGVHAGGGGDSTEGDASVEASATVANRVLTLPSATVFSPAIPVYPVPGPGSSASCNYYTDCYSCLSNSACLWDPNTLTGTCKPTAQCDFTYQPRALSLTASAIAAPPATACIRVVSQCNQPPPNGAILNPNPGRGLGCTNHGQCGANQYCYSCTKCVGNCGACNSPYGGIPVSGSCGPAYRCQIDGDSIDGTCPGSGVVSWPGSCSYYDCSSCTAAYGCIWSGTSCYMSSIPCSGYGCANSPAQCYGGGGVISYPGSCSYYDCGSCTAAPGCIWSGSFCYYSTTPCYGSGCANTPAQCYGGGVVTYPPTYPSTCNYYDCFSCTSAYGCIWSGSSCYYSTTSCYGFGCANSPSQCSNGYPISYSPYTSYTPYVATTSYTTTPYITTSSYTTPSYYNPWG